MQASSNWHIENSTLVRVVVLPHYSMVLAAAVGVGCVAMVLDHHPELSLSFNELRISLTSHDVGGVSERDYRFASWVDRLFECSATS
ncbi:MAG: 4a-hydroxytetrahydrobiopterin dehydratase [Ferrimicrobium sp.]